MNILSFDQSTRLTGWAYFEDGKYVDSGVIDKHQITKMDERIRQMGLAICHKIKELKPDMVVIENIQQQGNVKTVIDLARLQGCVILYCASKNIPLNVLHPTEWRRALQYHQGRGVAREELKQQSLDYISEHLGVTDFSEDRCEAICIGFASYQIF